LGVFNSADPLNVWITRDVLICESLPCVSGVWEASVSLPPRPCSGSSL